MCMREKDEKTIIKRLSTLMWLVHNLWEQHTLSQWSCAKGLCTFWCSLFSLKHKLKIWLTKLGYSLKIHKLEKKVVFKEEQYSCSTEGPDRVMKRLCLVWVLTVFASWKFSSIQANTILVRNSSTSAIRTWSSCKCQYILGVILPCLHCKFVTVL